MVIITSSSGASRRSGTALTVNRARPVGVGY
jgi:hypothetical protein